jgi:hypothetical protein
MKRLADNSIPVEFIGSRDTRFGSWARKLPKDEKMILEPDPKFIASLTKAELKLIWFDAGKAVRGKSALKPVRILLSPHPPEAEHGKKVNSHYQITNFTKIEVQAVDADVIMHMVEIIR